MNESQPANPAVPEFPRANVRFTKEEYLQLLKEQVATGMSIPDLLKYKYFSKPIFTPALDAETRAAVRREMGYIGNNLNQVAKYFHSGLLEDLRPKFIEVWEAHRILLSFLGLTNRVGARGSDGNGQNPL